MEEEVSEKEKIDFESFLNKHQGKAVVSPIDKGTLVGFNKFKGHVILMVHTEDVGWSQCNGDPNNYILPKYQSKERRYMYAGVDHVIQ